MNKCWRDQKAKSFDLKASLPIKGPGFIAKVESLGRFSLKNADVSAFS
jgi:hypothetical protein